ncbi:MAG: FAD-dependent oxidoreductase [Citricoccus sp.]|jgi:probable pyridine nucleotide-disulfide oxidoreductase|nr:FAD-dependent oxidoreductase [Citricoccus sp. WCRC_4]
MTDPARTPRTTPAATVQAAGSTPRHLEVDVLVIGWGKGGKTFAAAAAGTGRTVALVEQSAAMYGGACINIACVPTKALIHSASTRREQDDAQQFFEAAVTRRDSLTGRLNDTNFHLLFDRDTVTVVDGRARFVGERQVEVTPSAGGSGRAERMRITGRTVVVNTGSAPVIPGLPGADGPRVHDSTSLQHVTPFPRRLAIVGGGPVGLEFASMFSGFGAEVTVLNRGQRILPREDEDVADAVAEVLIGEGVTLRNGASVTELQDGPDGVAVLLEEGAGPTVDAVLFATGRRPATEGLGLDAAGIEVDDRGAIVVDDQLRTSADRVFAMGDVHGGQQQTYLSLDDHRVVLSALAGDGSRRVSDRVGVPATIFLTPPFSSVGLTERAAREAGRDVRVAFAKVAGIKAMPRPKAVDDPRGVIKVVVDAHTDQVLGARLFHVDSQEVVNLVALAMRAQVTASALRDGIWTHPSSTEALNEVLGQLS